MSQLTATIDRLAFGGNGVCRVDGKVCFVPFSCPGDEVELQIVSQNKSYCTASISRIISPSSHRTAPVCTIFGICGGCNWQHINYSEQIQQKRMIFSDTLWRGARVAADRIGDAVPALSPYGYRSRLQFKVSVLTGKLAIGFYRQGSHRVVDAVCGCPVASPTINQLLGCCRNILQSYPAIQSVTQLSINSGIDGAAVVIHQKGRITSIDKRYLVERYDDLSGCSGLYLKSDTQQGCEKLRGSSDVSYHLAPAAPDKKPVVLAYPPGGFAQVNQQQNEAMLSVIRRLGCFCTHDRLLDLYCGNGNFSIPLAAEVASVCGIEGNAESIRAAEQNKESNMVANVRFFCDDAASGVRRIIDHSEIFDTVLLDPPRTGAADVVSGIADLQPNKIIYVSCDPNTLARDCNLLSGHGYRVSESIPIDMFPQTYHLESVTLLCRL